MYGWADFLGIEKSCNAKSKLEAPMKTILAIASIAEAATGVILLVSPPLAIHALFDTEIGGAGVIMSRIAGAALIGLGVACWPGKSAQQQLYGMLAYSTLAMLYLVRIGVRGAPVGALLWPAVIVHAVLCVLLVWACWKHSKIQPGKDVN
jgi:hypothetical protein